MTMCRVAGLGCVCAWTLSLWAAPAVAQTPSTPPATMAVPVASPDDAERAAIRQLRAAYETAVATNQIEALAPLLHDDFHGVMLTGQAVTGFAGLKQYWADVRKLMGEGGKYTTALKPETTVFVGDLALTRGSSDDVVVTGSGDEFRFTTQWTAVLQKVNGQWKLRQAQGSIDPVNNPFVRLFTRRALQWALPVAGVVGILAGYLVGKVFGRRKPALARQA